METLKLTAKDFKKSDVADFDGHIEIEAHICPKCKKRIKHFKAHCNYSVIFKSCLVCLVKGRKKQERLGGKKRKETIKKLFAES